MTPRTEVGDSRSLLVSMVTYGQEQSFIQHWPVARTTVSVRPVPSSALV